MTLGSAAPLGLADWVKSIPTRLIAEGLAFDGLIPGPGAATITATFAGATIMRTAGSFIDDGFAVGQIVDVSGSTDNDGEYAIVATIAADVLTFTGGVAFASESDTAGVVVTAMADPAAFSVWIGTQNRDRWTGGNSVVFVPSSGAEEKPAAFHNQNAARRHIVTVRWSLDVLVWGTEPSLSDFRGLDFDAERLRSAVEIWENVARVLKGSAYGFGRIESIDAWDQETAVLRFGESLTMRYSVPIPLYDWPRTNIPTPQRLRPKAGEPIVKGPEQL